jgi:two-component system CheB/CheR fusion protein
MQSKKKRHRVQTRPTENKKLVEVAETRRGKAAKQASPESSLQTASPVSIVGIGASAGGLEAFQELLRALPEDTGMAFVLVQHLAPKHESILSELLSKATKMPVVEVREGLTVQPNHVYVIPPNADMSVVHGVLHLSTFGPDRSRRMPIDLFLRSLAEDQQGRAIGVILSGTASDGTLGLQAIKALGGVTFAQDDESAKYNAMPRSAVAAGIVDFVLAPDSIARELQRLAKHVHVLVADEHGDAEPGPVDEALNKVFAMLRNMSRVDFSYYKHGTIKRRIVRRMVLRKIDNLEEYLRFLRKNSEEVEALFNDVLINVTGFFRDPEAFDVLRKEAFPVMLNGKGPNAPIRIWVPGCSTGEEAYSLAIVLLEYLGERASDFQIQIFATDVSENIIQKARTGTYPESIAMDITSERLRRFFQKVDSTYQISKSVRDMCVFAKQDVAKDPPFSKLEMISCRNVMIYMGQLLQRRIIPLFHYALNPNGVLFLGSSETVGGFADLFTSIDKKYKIYAKKPYATAVAFDFVPQFDADQEPPIRNEPAPQRLDLQRVADKILLNRYAPASVMVNDKLDIVQFIGDTGRFLDPAPGDASLNLLKMVKNGLQLELQLGFQKVKRTGTVRKEGVVIEHNGSVKSVNFEVISVKNIPGKERYYLVVFEEVSRTQVSSLEATGTENRTKKVGTAKPTQTELESAHLKDELEATRDYLQSIIEEQRTTNEELRSANEEIQSSNEELQSINEELETAKEELQSTNEELTTVNQELQNRNDQLSQLNNDLNNLLSSVNIPIVMLGNDFRVRRFTPMAEKVMNLIATDVGRRLTDIKPNLKIQDLHQSIARVIETLEIYETQVEDNTGRWYSMKIRPYRTVDNKIDGVVIVLLDIDLRLRPAKQA